MTQKREDSAARALVLGIVGGGIGWVLIGLVAWWVL